MERYKIILSDGKRKIYEEATFKIASYLIACLAADPRNLSELEIAMGRFGPDMNLSWFSDQVRLKGEVESFLIINLPSRLVYASYDLAKMFPRGEVFLRSEKEDAEIPIRYWISDEWRIVESDDVLIAEEQIGIGAIDPAPKTDFRKVMYGRELSEFLTSRFTGDQISVHKEWLLEKREDLDGCSPREILLRDKDRVDFDLYSRELQWSFGGTCPPLIPLDSEAFRYAGFGTHEFVTYYDLIRHLLDNFTSDVEEMEAIKAKWFESPNTDGPSRIPSEIIESERKRLPLEATAAELLFDEDCPICQMMLSEFDTPTFLHLDAAHLDDEFVFSSYNTIEEWEQNKLEWEEFNKKFETEMKNKDLSISGKDLSI